MAFSSSVTNVTVVGNQRKISGTFTNTSTDYGGDITTGLSYIMDANVEVASHVSSGTPKVFLNQTSAGVATNGTLGIITDTDADGQWSVTGI